MSLKQCPGQLFVLTETFRLITYQPEPNLHFPVGIAEDVNYRIIGWSIVDAGKAGLPTYIVLLGRQPTHCDALPEMESITILSQFGQIFIKLAPPLPFHTCDDSIRSEICDLVLKALPAESEHTIVALLEAISSAIDSRKLELDIVRRAFPGASAVVDGVHEVRYVIGLDTHPPPIRAVESIQINCTPNITTTLRWKHDLPDTNILLVGDGQYRFATLREV